MKNNWPRLSESLTSGGGSCDLNHCQDCGVSADRRPLSRWMEHDENDKPEPIVVMLCEPCSDRLIEPHPRLYRRMDRHEPMPGAMPICTGCRHQSGLRCTNPIAQINGGPGLKMTYPKPSACFVDGRDKSGKRFGRQQMLYHGPVSECAGKEGAAP